MDEYTKSLYCETYTILGRELTHGLTLGHLLILLRLEAFPAKTNEDLFTCILVCTSDEYTLDEIFNDRWLDLKIAIWKWQLGNIDWFNAHMLWQEFVGDYMRIPAFKRVNEGEGESSDTPFIQVLITTLVSKCGIDYEAAKRMSFNEAVWLYLTYWEIEGQIIIKDRDERKRMKELADKYKDAN